MKKLVEIKIKKVRVKYFLAFNLTAENECIYEIKILYNLILKIEVTKMDFELLTSVCSNIVELLYSNSLIVGFLTTKFWNLFWEISQRQMKWLHDVAREIH